MNRGFRGGRFDGGRFDGGRFEGGGFEGGRFDNREEGMRNDDEDRGNSNRDFGRGRERGGRGRDGRGERRERKDDDKTVASAEEIDERIARREALKSQQVNRNEVEVCHWLLVLQKGIKLKREGKLTQH